MFALIAAVFGFLAVIDVISFQVMLEWWLTLIALHMAFGSWWPWTPPPWNRNP